jgi:hypothetical protein
MPTGQPSSLVIGGHDQLEDQAERNEGRIAAAASSGQWALLEPTVDRTLGARIQRRPIGSWLVQAKLGDLLPGSDGPLPAGGDGGLSASAGSGAGVLRIGQLTLRWPSKAPAPSTTLAAPKVQTAAVQRSGSGSGSGSSAAPPGFAETLGSSPGQSLSGDVQARLEQTFGADFSQVRVHTDPISHDLNRQISARAFTVGQDIYFGQGQYAPSTPTGLGLLGHELTHTVQQRSAARVMASPLGRGGLIQAAGERQVARLSASAPGGGGGMPGPTGGGGGPPPAGPTAGGARVIIRALEVITAGAGSGGVGPGMEVAHLKATSAAGPGAVAVARAHGGEPGPAPPSVEELLRQSIGLPLPTGIAGHFSALFGVDFADVRVHTDGPAAQASNALRAEAFATGRDVYFAQGRYDPSSPRGMALLGHELTHVAQGSGGAPTLRRASASPAREQTYTRPSQFFIGWNPRGTVHEQFFARNKAFWEKLGVEGIEKGGVAGTGQAAVAALMAGFNDPFGEMDSDAAVFQRSLQAAIARSGEVSYDDPQRRTWAELKEFFGRTGTAAFNRAPGGAEATQETDRWVKEHAGKGGGTNLEEVIFAAIKANKGNVTLAMGSLAEVLCEGDNRALAARIQGLRNNQKDYYVFAGAYVALQPGWHEQFLGYLGSHGNIAGNPLAYSAMGALQWVSGAIDGDAKERAEGVKAMTTRWGVEANYWKFHEFNAGFFGARGVRRKSLVVAGHDAAEEQALANERAIFQAYTSGPILQPTPGAPRLLAADAARRAVAPQFAELLRRAAGGSWAGQAQPSMGLANGGGGFSSGLLRLAASTEGGRLQRKESPAVGGECKPTRDAWWARHAVAAFGVGWALWDFGKGAVTKRGFEELRGSASKELIASLRERLLKKEAKLTPDVIYAEARTLVPDARQALQLAFSLVCDTYDLPWAPMPGIEAGEALHDKYEHFFASAILAHRSNARGSFFVGWLKEVGDIPGTGYSEPDLMADALGAEFGQNLQCADMVTEPAQLQRSAQQIRGLLDQRTNPPRNNRGVPLRRAKTGARPLDELARELDVASRGRRSRRLQSALETLDQPGLPLELGLKNKLERELGVDLSAMRLHTGLEAERLAGALGAEAFALGHRVVLGEGAWRPDAPEGLGTLAHEAVHVVQAQQGRIVGPDTPARTAHLEAEAHAREDMVVSRAGGRRAARALPVDRPAAAPPPMVVREASSQTDDLPAPIAAADGGGGVLKKLRRTEKKRGQHEHDPVQRVMEQWAVTDLSREEFVATCTERVMDLMREELEVTNERGGTCAWDPETPLV